jgi:ribose/xylose/arabinose/galactoside ABC-type transport system permease subunit
MNSIAKPRGRVSGLRRRSIAGAREYGVVIALVLLFIVLSIASEPFLTKPNLLNILSQWSIEGVMAVG